MTTRRTRIPGPLGKIDFKAVPCSTSALVFNSYVGDGALDRSLVISGFLPTFAWVTNSDGADTAQTPYIKTPDMAVGSSYGVTPALLNTNRIDILEATGIRIDSGAEVNALGIAYDVIAIRNAIGKIKIISYVGDGVNDRAIIGLGFDPVEVIALQVSSSNFAMVKAPNFAPDQSVSLRTGGTSTNRLKTLITDGFTLGTSGVMNGPGDTYQAICFAEFNDAEGKVKREGYTGDGVDNRAITGVGFQPKFVLISSASNDNVHKSESMGAFSKRHGTPTMATDMIKSFDADGFTLGTNAAANGLGNAYSALCLSD